MWLLLLTACRALTVADVTTGESEAYPELRSIHQPIPARLLFRHAQEVAAARPGWTGCEELEPRHLRCQAEGPLGAPATIDLLATPAGLTASRLQLRVKTESPIGGDLGFGAREIQGFEAAFLEAPPSRTLRQGAPE